MSRTLYSGTKLFYLQDIEQHFDAPCNFLLQLTICNSICKIRGGWVGKDLNGLARLIPLIKTP